MNDKKNRVKILRKNLKLTQKEFGDAIGVSNSNISNIENGSVNLTDRNIYEICSKFNVNKCWLETGIGDMFSKLDSDEEFHYLVGQFSAENDEFKKRIIKGMLQLKDRDSWELVVKMVEKLAKAEENSTEE